MFLLFFFAGLFELLDAFEIEHTSTTIMQQIYGASTLGTGTVLIFAAVVDAWYWTINGRLKRIDASLAALPKAIAREMLRARDAELDDDRDDELPRPMPREAAPRRRWWRRSQKAARVYS